MSSNFGRSLFVSGLSALPVPFIIPFAVDAVSGEQTFSELLSGDAAVAFYLISWVLITLAAVIAISFSSGKIASASHDDEDQEESGEEGSEIGTVKWFNVNKGFGFITTEAGEDIFVHFRSIRGRGRRSLRQGQSVRFDIAKGDKGLQAENVSVVGK